MKTNIIINGDCIEEMKKLPDNSIDAIITDPPYGLEFMGKDWDKFKNAENIGGGTMENRNTPYQRGEKTPPAYYIWTLEQKNEFQIFSMNWAKECLRVLKPGGYLLSFGGTRTYHRMACGIEDAGFEIRDTIMWVYGSGFPKSLNIGKQIDKMPYRIEREKIKNYLAEWIKKCSKTQKQIDDECGFRACAYTRISYRDDDGWGSALPTEEKWKKMKEVIGFDNTWDDFIKRAEREVIGKKKTGFFEKNEVFEQDNEGYGTNDITLPETNSAKEWEGWGTALKPAVEPIVVARKPLSEKNVALNVLKWGTGGINIDECRIEYKSEEDKNGARVGFKEGEIQRGENGIMMREGTPFKSNNGLSVTGENGRFPANIILDEEAGQMLDEQSGNVLGSHNQKFEGEKNSIFNLSGNDIGFTKGFNDKGGASRFFYCAKASKSERNFGCDELEDKELENHSASFNVRMENGVVTNTRTDTPRKNNHPTVKPIKLMEYLIKLVSKENAVILDPFLGSGTTAIACLKTNRKFIGIEKEPDYIKIAEARIKPYLEQTKLSVESQTFTKPKEELNRGGKTK